MNDAEQVEYFKGCHNAAQHYFSGEPECVFCGCFGPTDDYDPCVTRENIGRQVAFLIDKLQRIKALVNIEERYDVKILDILNERPNWPKPNYEGA